MFQNSYRVGGRSALLLLSFFFSPVLATGQATFINIGAEKGLSSLQITDLYQDGFGFIWIGTNNGLNRYDGYNCVQYSNLPSDTATISSNQISKSAFAEDKSGNLWVATFRGGLNYFDRNTERFHHYRRQKGNTNSLGMDKISAIEADGKGGLWVATAGRGVAHFDPNSRIFHALNPDSANRLSDLGNSTVSCLEQSKGGWLWLGMDRGIGRYDPATEQLEYFSYAPNTVGSLSHGFVTDILEDSRQTVWIGTANGLNRWNVEKKGFEPCFFAHHFPGNDAAYNYIHKIEETDDGRLWLGTNAGLLRFNPLDGTVERFLNTPLDPFSILKGPVTAILKDRNGNFWFGTPNGLSLLNKVAQNLNHARLSPLTDAFGQIALTEGFNDVIEVGQTLWVATQTGVYRLAGTLQRIANGNFTALFWDQQQMQVYAGTVVNGFFLFDANSGVQLHHFMRDEAGQKLNPQRVKGGRICGFAQDCQGFVWIAADGGLNRHHPQTGQFRKFFGTQKRLENPSANTNHHLMADRQGNLWIATMGGLSRLSNAELSKPFDDPDLKFEHFLQQPGTRNSISSDVVFCLLEDSDGSIWAGTESGLNRFNPKSGVWEWFFKSSGLPDNEIVSLVEDREGNIWAASAHDGVCKFDKASKRFFRFSLKDGFRASHFRPNAGICTTDGLVVLGARDGLAGFQPERLVQFDTGTTSLYFTDFRLFNKSVPIGGEGELLRLPIYKTERIELEYDQKVISFQFAALNFINPEKQVYRFRLAPFHHDWQFNGSNREVTFTNLDPGEYQLIVETSENGYDWTSKTLQLRILPPWYQRWWAYLLFATLAGAVLYGIRRYELRQQFAKAEAQRLQELDLAKTRLYTNITHEFRTPLTIILGEATQLEKQAVERQRGGLAAIRRQGRQLLHLVNQMLDLAKVEAGSLQMNLSQGNVVLFLKYLLESFQSLADDRKIELRFESDTETFLMDFDPDKLQKIVSNLLSNALKFTAQGGSTTMRIRTGTSLVLEVRDTGQGIPPEKRPYIFDRFYQGDDSLTRPGEGTGIGLTLTKELVQLLGGQIEVDSELGEGTTFRVQLPVTRHAAPGKTEQLIESQVLIPEPLVPVSATPGPVSRFKTDRARLLLVEDNADVTRYIKGLLQADYQIITEENGKKGLESAFRLVPDIIISDVMMPEMDGFEFCRQLKTDERTSHIPVVLLTAKADQPSKIEGLRYGADAYLAKPFHPEELFVRLEKLIELRRRLRERYGRFSRFVHPEKIGFGKPADPLDLEERFLQKALRIVEENMGDEAFDMLQLCKALNMSRSNLFRKIKALTGQSATTFIRNQRLEQARTLLLATDLNVTEVCFRVGFSSPNYFSRAFQEEFGVPPSGIKRG